jgi:3-oxoacyl-[acyl-carrier-protein] synthase-3
VIDLDSYGNTVSNTIPIALANLVKSNRLQPGQRVMLVGFGVGYSWSACMMQWPM